VSREKEFIKRASERSPYQQKVLKSSGVPGGIGLGSLLEGKFMLRLRRIGRGTIKNRKNGGRCGSRNCEA
jgi:hypothetical protein